MNRTVLIGRLARDPELRYTQSQMAVCRITIAVDKGKDKGADFIPVVIYGKQGENVQRYMSKGRQVAIEGRISTGSYEKKDGTKVYTTDVIADRVEFLGHEPQEKTQGNYVEVEDISDQFEAVGGDIPF